MKFTKEQACDILYGDSIIDEHGNTLYEAIESSVIDTDSEKGRVSYRIVIKEFTSGKFYVGYLTKSSWYKQDEENAQEEWKEVQPVSKTITVYE